MTRTLIVALVGACTLFPGVARAATPAHVRDVWRQMSGEAPAALGDDLACVNIPGRAAGRPSIRLYVVRRSALPAARRLVRRLHAEPFTTVGVLDPRYGVRPRRVIAELIRQGALARGVLLQAVRATESPDIAGRRCPRVMLYGYAFTPEQLAWAEAQRTNWGGRVGVSVSLIQPGAAIPTTSQSLRERRAVADYAEA
jgi:hypothetical protein